MYKQYLLLVLLALTFKPSFSQTTQGRKYATQAYMSALRSSDSTFQKKSAAIESSTLDFKQYGSMDTFYVPVVFHVLYKDVSPISADDIEAQLARLNTDFFDPENPYVSDEEYKFQQENNNLTYLHPADRYEGYASKTASPMIKFCFPQLDPQGDSTNGVLVISVASKNWGLSDSLKRNDLGGSSPWDPAHYCNIWVASLSDSIAGYAQMPGGNSTTDGIVIDQRYFLRADGSVPPEAGGNDFALGRTLVHLMGSYLNVHELWNEETPCGDDLVEDTPIHNAPNYGKNEYKHVTTCDGHAVEMTMNLMDSGCDSTMYMFTWGQVARMQATLHNSRKELKLTTTGCSTELEKIEERSAERIPNTDGTLRVRAVPNPNSGDFTIEIQADGASEETVSIQVFNPSGSMMLEKKMLLMPSSVSRLPIIGYDWPSGIYSVRVSTQKEVQVKQVILNR